jgi:hypothetical protein
MWVWTSTTRPLSFRLDRSCHGVPEVIRIVMTWVINIGHETRHETHEKRLFKGRGALSRPLSCQWRISNISYATPLTGHNLAPFPIRWLGPHSPNHKVPDLAPILFVSCLVVGRGATLQRITTTTVGQNKTSHGIY